MFQLSEESKVRNVPMQCQFLNAHTTTGAHRAHHRCLPCRYPLRLSAFDPLSWLLSEPAETLPHPVRCPDTQDKPLYNTLCLSNP